MRQSKADYTMHQSVKRIIKLWAGQQYRERGDSFATLPELKAICSDPLGWLDLMQGYDAFDVLRLAWRHHDCRY